MLLKDPPILKVPVPVTERMQPVVPDVIVPLISAVPVVTTSESFRPVVVALIVSEPAVRDPALTRR